MVEKRFGRVVNVSSVAGSAYLSLVAAHYSATKAEVIGLTRHLAGELGEFGITANALAPGRIAPPFSRRSLPLRTKRSLPKHPFVDWDNLVR
ncbi:SDR family NAD(P)-dependent oxidoreductase [Pseudomonas syringae]|uniref:SDR family NAD(P)-dependent oxidoreductase n=1 Tax=Pseudomonas syringae TaxID=317 RepID=UPI00211EFDB7|nr:SDR family NAD(P)-dependent oxidoreductase [Pseudomonas syringae]